MENKFTPGPWTYNFEGLNKHTAAIFTINTENGNVLSLADVYGSDETDTADAKLIAAAPEMFEALQYIISSDANTKEAYRKALAVLNKATL